MNAFRHALSGAITALALVGPVQAAGFVEVSYLEPEKFADAGRSSVDRERTLRSLTTVLQKFATQLPDGQTLRLEVLDIDLAGELRPWGPHEVRVMRGRADWPTIRLRYTLSQGGSTLKTGEARISDMNYLQNQRGLSEGAGDLAYEKRMLQAWFAQTFAAPH